MSDYPLCLEDESSRTPQVPEPVTPLPRPYAPAEDNSEHFFDWDSADLVTPGALSPARQLAMQRQQERLAAPAVPRKPEENL